MPKVSKRQKTINAKIDPVKVYGLEEAVSLLKECALTKFDETVDVAMNLGVDPKHADQQVRGVVQLPHGTGKTVRVAVFARGDKAKEAQDAGADIVGADDLVEAISAGKVDFERCIATPDMMGLVGKLGKVLGPKGLMPNPKLGTVTMQVADAVKAVKSGQVEFRTEKTGLIHAGIGKVSFSASQITENIKTFVSAIVKAKPSGAKGIYIQKVTLSSTMGPGIKINLGSVAN